jgi:cation diffusion facilitator family transporter
MQQSSIRQQVRRVLLITLFLNFGVAIGKIILGFVTGVLAIIADGFHSLVDGSSNVVALVANRIADRPPDAEHPYGHRRFETIAALAIGGFLLLTAWEIVSSVLERLGGSGQNPEVTPLSFVIMIVTLGVNVFISRYETREGHRLKSEVLLADSAHTRSDVLVTSSVLVSMALVGLFGWAWVDTIAALVIVVLILRAAWHVLRQTGSVLVDTAPFSPEQLTSLVEDVPAVNEVMRARSRGPADAAHIDIDVKVAPEMTTGHSAAIANAIRDKLKDTLDGVAEVEVHFEPEREGEIDYALAARACADALGLATHEVYMSEVDSAKGTKMMELHVEVPPGQTLDEAHQQVSQLEQNLRQQFPEVVEVVTHIEPTMNTNGSPVSDGQQHTAAIEAQAKKLLDADFPDIDWHHFHVRPYERGFILTLHATLPPRISIESAHGIAEAAETHLKREIPDLDRVTIHTEPPETAE